MTPLTVEYFKDPAGPETDHAFGETSPSLGLTLTGTETSGWAGRHSCLYAMN